jgi:hypothetical protein
MGTPGWTKWERLNDPDSNAVPRWYPGAWHNASWQLEIYWFPLRRLVIQNRSSHKLFAVEFLDMDVPWVCCHWHQQTQGDKPWIEEHF